MMFILGVALLCVLLLVSRWYVSADPKVLVKVLKRGLLTGAMGGLLWLLLSGRLVALFVALPAILVWLMRLLSGLRAARMFTDRMGGGSGRRAASSAHMTRQEALKVLGLREGATADEIKAAHRHLMTQVHPDVGGTDYLAQQINQAKDVLLV